MKESAGSNATYWSLAIEHLRNAAQYAKRGHRIFFDPDVPDTYLPVESELRKASESLNRLGQSFWRTNRALPRERIAEIRRLLTHDYTDVDRELVWSVAAREAPVLLRRLTHAKLPKLGTERSV